MARATGNNYFKLLEEMAQISCRAAEALEEILTDFRLENLDKDMQRLHAIEHEGDERRHELLGKLVKEFITPIEREDIMAITNRIDDVTDAVEDVLLKMYMFNIQVIHKDAVPFAQVITKCCRELQSVLKEFSNFKKSKAIYDSVIELNRLEEQGDVLYLNAVRGLHLSPADAKETAAWTEIFRCMERVCDTCEHAADIVEHVIMRNT